MSEPNLNSAQEVPLAQQPTPTASSASPKSPEKSGQQGAGLSTFLKVSIILLAGLTIASISLLFIGDFEGKFPRVFSTFALFAVFVLLTALDAKLGKKSEWYAPVALIANAYILGLLLIVIWMTPYAPFGLVFSIFWKSLFVVVATRAVILCCQVLLKSGERRPESVTRFAFITSMLAVLCGILFTAPVGIEAFELSIPDLYWKIAVAILILTALALSITMLLRWNYGSEAREARRQEQAAVQPAQAAVQAAVQPAQPVLPVAPNGAPLLPWPTFPDGRPLPAGADGQPDFSVLQPPAAQ